MSSAPAGGGERATVSARAAAASSWACWMSSEASFLERRPRFTSLLMRLIVTFCDGAAGGGAGLGGGGTLAAAGVVVSGGVGVEGRAGGSAANEAERHAEAKARRSIRQRRGKCLSWSIGEKSRRSFAKNAGLV